MLKKVERIPFSYSLTGWLMLTYFSSIILSGISQRLFEHYLAWSIALLVGLYLFQLNAYRDESIVVVLIPALFLLRLVYEIFDQIYFDAKLSDYWFLSAGIIAVSLAFIVSSYRSDKLRSKFICSFWLWILVCIMVELAYPRLGTVRPQIAVDLSAIAVAALLLYWLYLGSGITFLKRWFVLTGLLILLGFHIVLSMLTLVIKNDMYIDYSSYLGIIIYSAFAIWRGVKFLRSRRSFAAKIG